MSATSASGGRSVTESETGSVMVAEALLTTILRLDAENQLAELNRYLRSHSFPDADLLAALRALLKSNRLRAAFFLAMMWHRSGKRSDEIALSLSLGGISYGYLPEALLGLSELQESVQQWHPARPNALLQEQVIPILRRLVAQSGERFDPAIRHKMVAIIDQVARKQAAGEEVAKPVATDERVWRQATAEELLQRVVLLASEPQDAEQKLQHFFSNGQFTIGQLLTLLHDLLKLKPPALETAFLLARLLDHSGERYWLISVVLSLAGLLYQDNNSYIRGLEQLQSWSERFSDAQRDEIYTHNFAPLIEHLLREKGGWLGASRQEQFALLAIAKAIVPELQTVFDQQAEVTEINRASLQRLAAATRSQRLSFALPSRPAQARHAVFFMVDSYVLHRLEQAMLAYGWQVTIFPIHTNTDGRGWLLTQMYEAMQLCQRLQADLFVTRFDQIMQGRPTTSELLRLFRQEMPSIKIVALSLDAWTINNRLFGRWEGFAFHPMVHEIMNLLDVFWMSDIPLHRVWEMPPFVGKVLRTPLPHAGFFGPPDPPLAAEIRYVGNWINPALWFRAFWPLLTEQLSLPVVYQQHPFLDAKGVFHQGQCTMTRGEQALHTYAQHKQGLHAATVVLNMTRKPNLQCIVTHRSFEAPLNGALLVQEYSPEMHLFFTPGEHYLEFQSIAELAAICRFLLEDPEGAEAIRARGSAYAREQYHDGKLIGYLDQFLWG
ncbi:MAG: glycosyltransferase family 1 protein [Magnetococcales bacterium]|nr:glycosyltransferase family 1 protein [Magnetococcales bacterium]